MAHAFVSLVVTNCLCPDNRKWKKVDENKMEHQKENRVSAIIMHIIVKCFVLGN